MSELSKIDMIVATPKPLSAPKVVPFAFTQSPSTSILIPSVSKSKFTSLFFWQTISKCDCITIDLRFSIPAVAGFLIITFPTSSTVVSNPRFSPNSLMKAITFSSFFDGLGTAFNLEKFFQIICGSILDSSMKFLFFSKLRNKKCFRKTEAIFLLEARS